MEQEVQPVADPSTVVSGPAQLLGHAEDIQLARHHAGAPGFLDGTATGIKLLEKTALLPVGTRGAPEWKALCRAPTEEF